MVLPHAYVFAGIMNRATLPDKNIARLYLGPSEYFDTQPLAV
jgi:hypothetical protein